jgi:hypothetical protein
MNLNYKSIVELATEMLNDKFPKASIEVTLVQTHYMPKRQQTIFMVVAQVNGVFVAGSGESMGKAIEMIIKDCKG